MEHTATNKREPMEPYIPKGDGYLKDRTILEPTSWPTIHAIDAHGFRAYEKPGGEFYSVYELISYLLCGDESLTFFLRLETTLYAMQHFETYVAKLTDTFDSSHAAKIFFQTHGIQLKLGNHISWQQHKRKCVADAFDTLAREAMDERKGNAPFYVEFLSGVLNRKITQHFEDKRYDGRKVDTIAGLDVSLTTDSSSDRELHLYWMKSNDHIREKSYWLKCVPNYPGMEACDDVYKLLIKQDVFEEQRCLDIINSQKFEFDKLKEHSIFKPDTTSMRTINKIKVEGCIAYEMPGEETTGLYELMSYLLLGNSEMKYIMRLAAIRYALQNFGQYVSKLTGEFQKDPTVSTQVKNAKLFFEIHNIEFEKPEGSSMEYCVLKAFTGLVRETVNTGQGPFYVEFLRGALNCKINQYTDYGMYNRLLTILGLYRPSSTIPGFNVRLTTRTPPERQLRIYRMKTSRRGRSIDYKIVPLFKNEDHRE